MSYAPADLLAVQRYLRDKTGQAWVSLGIVGDQSHNSSGGYHVGVDVLRALGTAPEQPGSDYSYTESSRDRAGLTEGASAFDFGGGFPRFLEFNAWIVGRARARDPRCRDMREIIHTLDGRTVRRWDALGIRSSGDSSHLTHTHFSFFRDSEGRRARDDNFLGLLKEFFDGTAPVTTGDDDMAGEGPEILARIKEIEEMHIYGPDKRNALAYWLRTFQEQQWTIINKKVDALTAALTIVAQAEKVDDAKLAEIKAAIADIGRPTDEQVTAIADRIAQALRDDDDNPVTEAHLDAVTEAVKRALREGTGTPAGS